MAWNEPGNNGKDPWGHRNNDQGPPDLDELVKKMQSKLEGLLGNGGSNGGSLSPKSLGLIAVLLLAVWSLFGFYIVQPAERGVEKLFGRFQQITSEGLNWYYPFPVGAVQKVNVAEVRSVKHEALMLTQDENIVVIEMEVQYNVKEADKYLFRVRDPDKTLREATESALREVVGTSKMDDVLTSGRALASTRTKDLIQEIVDRYSTGLEVRSVNMQNAQPPQQVQAAFADVIKAREDEERLKNTAQAYANEVVQKAGGRGDQLRQEALAYQSKMEQQASGEAQRFISVLTEYRKAPAVTRQRLYLETMEEVLANTSKVVVGGQNSNNLMYLPLDKLFQQSAHGPENVHSGSAEVPYLKPGAAPMLQQEIPTERSRRTR